MALYRYTVLNLRWLRHQKKPFLTQSIFVVWEYLPFTGTCRAYASLRFISSLYGRLTCFYSYFVCSELLYVQISVTLVCGTTSIWLSCSRCLVALACIRSTWFASPTSSWKHIRSWTSCWSSASLLPWLDSPGWWTQSTAAPWRLFYFRLRVSSATDLTIIYM